MWQVQMNCPRCNAPNTEDKNYCGDCGTPLNPSLVYLEGFIKAQVKESLDARFKDQKLLEVETSQAVIERVKSWTTLFGYFVAIPIALLVLAFAVFGIKEFRDFRALVKSAQDQLKPRLEQAKSSADNAKQQADEAQREAAEAKKTIQSASGVATQVRTLSAQFSQLENQTSLQMKNASERADKQLRELDSKIESATKDIAEQQKKLASTNELVKSIFERGRTEYFDTKSQNSHFVLLSYRMGDKSSAKNGAFVFMLLAEVPIRQTIELKFHLSSQPRGSYSPIRGNVLWFNWGENAESLKEFPLEVTYIPDPTASSTMIFKSLSIRERRVYADETLVMDLHDVPEK